MTTFFIFLKVLSTALMSIVAIHLAYAALNPARHKAILKKYKGNELAQSLYRFVYSKKFLIAWAIMTAWAIIGIVYDWYRLNHTPSSILLLVMFFGSLVVLAITGMLLLQLFRDKDY